MGCISSKTDINDIHHNIFQVMNVDERGNRVNPGQLEITETDLVLHQRRKTPVKWPLRSLRRYGYDAELFSFESGRRCPSGPGIYAFRCQRAEQLFNLLQSHIQLRNSAGEDGLSRDFSVPSGHALSLRGSSSGDSNYLDPTPIRSNRTSSRSTRITSTSGVISSRLDSVGSSSNGPLSPQGTASPSPPPSSLLNPALVSFVSSSNPTVHYANEEFFQSTGTDPSDNNREQLRHLLRGITVSLPDECSVREKPRSRLSVCSRDGFTSSGISDPSSVTASYVNVDINPAPLSPSYSEEDNSNLTRFELLSESPVYMNLIPGPENVVATQEISVPLRAKPSLPPSGSKPKIPFQSLEIEESKRCYANLQPSEVERYLGYKHMSRNIPPLYPTQAVPLVSLVNTQRQVNYIVLDLDQNKRNSGDDNESLSRQTQSQPLTISVLPPSEGVQRTSEGYATIDFDKTVALSHSMNPNMGNDTEGSRKTRHNSTISELQTQPVRNSSSD